MKRSEEQVCTLYTDINMYGITSGLAYGIILIIHLKWNKLIPTMKYTLVYLNRL